MTQTAPARAASRTNPRLPALVFGIGIAAFVLYMLTIAIKIHSENDFYREAWLPYRLLSHGHVIAFIRQGPGYVGSLVLRAPFALAAAVFGAGARATYIATALPCLLAPAILAAWLAPDRREKPDVPAGTSKPRIRPLDLFMLTPPAIICVTGGHPEDVLGATLCVTAVLLAQRGSAHTAGVMLGFALINKSWALIAAPLIIVLIPAERRLAGLGMAVLVAAVVMVPVLAIRMTGSGGSGAGLGSGAGGIFLVPQLLWFFGRNSWVAREGHIILVAVGWLLTAAWWWFCVHDRPDRPHAGTALTILALVFFLRAALDPWDNVYYFAPFILTIMAYEDANGFPRLSWAFVIMVVVIVPVAGLLSGLGDNGHAAVFGIWALGVIAYLARRAFVPDRTETGPLYAAASRSGS